MILSNILPTFEIANITAAAVFIFFLTLVNVFVAPIIKLFAFPINFLTLGLFNSVLNLLIIGFVTTWINGVDISGNFFSTLLTLILISLSMSLAQSIVGNYSD